MTFSQYLEFIDLVKTSPSMFIVLSHRYRNASLFSFLGRLCSCRIGFHFKFVGHCFKTAMLYCRYFQ